MKTTNATAPNVTATLQRHTCVSCGGRFTSASPAPNACHGSSSCPFDEPDNWETYESDQQDERAEWDDPV
ncbi:hypothetical protein [Deinococcus ruber]|uniref:Uncharacterized protein n=1 Tax=Deinococcus ruber TaxID=1848197 RepID=A0A918FAG1_9DEIO|nr:hypothetical protein [Deinococcus ruber]GGR16356.1 hypothetical protein GCM10008957_31250 [Deinococcus ruber]